MTTKETKRARWNRWERYLDLASEAGAIAMSLRDRPRRLDWAGAALRVAGLICRIRAEHREATAGDPWSYFDPESSADSWVEIPEEFRKLILEHISDVEVVDGFWDGDSDSTRVCMGRVGGEPIGWLSEGGDGVVDGPYLRADRADRTYRALGTRIWRRLATPHIAYSSTGLTADTAGEPPALVTRQVRELKVRIAAFLARDVPRSYLLVGPPGTGKSAAIRQLASGLGLTSLRIEIDALRGRYGYSSGNLAAQSLETMLKLLEPEALILDDIDRVSVGGELLQFLELASRTCRIVLASANCTAKMMGAALRPGRFDEVVEVDRLDPAVLRQLVGDDEQSQRVAGLPVAYVAEFLKRRDVLGSDRALAELDELIGRAKSINDRTDGGG